MIISPGRRYIFVHIPKTGGTSLASALEARAMKDDVLIGDTPKARRRRKRHKESTSAGRLWKHSTLADIDGLVDAGTIAESFCFTMVRNPWDRLVSYYTWARAQSFDHPAVALSKQTTFSEFLNAPETQSTIRANRYAQYMTAADGAEFCSLYIRLEHFKQDASLLWEHLGFELALPHENRSARERGYRQYFSDSDKNLVKSLCHEDIVRFCYTF
ncbi:MAG: sulfotransferase family 2 domain-containing protein [Pseudomonadota bacterium]